MSAGARHLAYIFEGMAVWWHGNLLLVNDVGIGTTGEIAWMELGHGWGSDGVNVWCD